MFAKQQEMLGSSIKQLYRVLTLVLVLVLLISIAILVAALGFTISQLG